MKKALLTTALCLFGTMAIANPIVHKVSDFWSVAIYNEDKFCHAVSFYQEGVISFEPVINYGVFMEHLRLNDPFRHNGVDSKVVIEFLPLNLTKTYSMHHPVEHPYIGFIEMDINDMVLFSESAVIRYDNSQVDYYVTLEMEGFMEALQIATQCNLNFMETN